MTTDPTTKHRDEGFPKQETDQPGLTSETAPTPDHGEHSYVGHGLLSGRHAIISGGDSGIGRAVAIAFAREGADVTLSYLPEEQADAETTARWVRDAGRTAVLVPGDAREEQHARDVVETTLRELGGVDLVVANAGYQKERPSLDQLPTEEFDRVMRTNLYGTFWLVREALPHLEAGSSIIVTASIQAFNPSPTLIDYAMTKAAQVAFVRALAQQQGPNGIRVNAVAPGPIWTPLIPGTGWPDKLPSLGPDTPLGRAGQPAEVAGAYVYVASEAASYVSGAVLPVTGGKSL